MALLQERAAREWEDRCVEVLIGTKGSKFLRSGALMDPEQLG